MEGRVGTSGPGSKDTNLLDLSLILRAFDRDFNHTWRFGCPAKMVPGVRVPGSHPPSA